MPCCVVKWCKNYTNRFKKCNGITFHRFPRNKILKDEWVRIIRNSMEHRSWNPYPSANVCSAHFDDADIKTTAKGLRCLVPDAVPKKLLSKDPEVQTLILSSTPNVLRVPPNVRVVETDKPSSSSAPHITVHVPPAKTLTRYCRLCAAPDTDRQLVNLQNDEAMKKLVVNMTKRLNTYIDFNQEHLPKTVCTTCVTALYTAYDFVVGIDLAQKTLNNILLKRYVNQTPQTEDIDVKPDLSSTSLQQVQMIPDNESMQDNLEQMQEDEAVDIKPDISSINPSLQQFRTSPNPGAETYNLNQSQPLQPNTTGLQQKVSLNIEVAESFSSTAISVVQVPPNIGPAVTSNLTGQPLVFDTPRMRILKDKLNKKSQYILGLRRKIKTMSQKIRRLQRRNEKFKHKVKNIESEPERILDSESERSPRSEPQRSTQYESERSPQFD